MPEIIYLCGSIIDTFEELTFKLTEKDKLHRRKINLCRGYRRASTRSEAIYAKEIGKSIRCLE